MSETNLTPAGQTAPAAFDYSGLDVRTVDTLHWAENRIRDSRRKYIADVAEAVAIVHDELCGGVVSNWNDSKHGNREEDAFCRWCESVGISKATAYRLLQVNTLLSGATPEEQDTLAAASPSLLYAAAKPSAPADLVQAVKDGDITTHKQYQELLKENQQLRADRVEALSAAQAAERARDAAQADFYGLHEENKKLRSECAEAEKQLDNAQTYAEEMERQADLAENEKAELAARLREMENRPRDVAVVQPSEADKEKYRKEGETRMMDAAQKLAESANAARDDALRTLADLQDALPDADSCQRLADAAADALDGFSVALHSSLKAANLDAGLFCSVTRRVCASARKLLGYLEACTPAGADEDEEDDIFQ